MTPIKKKRPAKRCCEESSSSSSSSSSSTSDSSSLESSSDTSAECSNCSNCSDSDCSDCWDCECEVDPEIRLRKIKKVNKISTTKVAHKRKKKPARHSRSKLYPFMYSFWTHVKRKEGRRNNKNYYYYFICYFQGTRPPAIANPIARLATIVTPAYQKNQVAKHEHKQRPPKINNSSLIIECSRVNIISFSKKKKKKIYIYINCVDDERCKLK